MIHECGRTPNLNYAIADVLLARCIPYITLPMEGTIFLRTTCIFSVAFDNMLTVKILNLSVAYSEYLIKYK